MPTVGGLNVVYNQQSSRNLFQVNTRANDQVDLVFGDGNFSNIPQGSFRFYYRTSNGATYSITPNTTTYLVEPVSSIDDIIYVYNAGALDEPNLAIDIWGVITINGERIMYRERDTVARRHHDKGSSWSRNDSLFRDCS